MRVNFTFIPARRSTKAACRVTAARKDVQMIVVTGATGTLNGATVDHLLKRMPPHQIGVSVRDPTRAAHLAARGVRVRQGSYDDPGPAPLLR